MNHLAQWWSKTSPSLKLMLAYTLIIMVISLFFTVALYRVSANQLSTTVHREYIRYRAFQYNADGDLMPLGSAQDEIDAALGQLRLQLVYFNVVILLAGSGLSYWLAKRTLRPIEEALAAQTRFTADASHELRTPLTAMQTEIEVALRDAGLTHAQAVALLRSNLEEVGKLRALADGLLRLARQAETPLALRVVSLEEAASQAMNQVLAVAQAKGVAIDNEVGQLMVRGDLPSLKELLVILLDNAVKYSDQGTTVRLTAHRQGRLASLVVTDQGQGIRGSDLPHIFDRFYRSDSSRSKVKADGYGLGLSIAKKIVDLHQGTIEAKSVLEKGTVFTIRLPLAEA
ncbi:MAG TPA: HAMP domain-containing sensor histidine kinase [Candidatus Saccharimonadia bacterium]|nr:HAMP domain-containing sensor histidine kinase [Candidatus Saccharimonadia bacterium]